MGSNTMGAQSIHDLTRPSSLSSRLSRREFSVKSFTLIIGSGWFVVKSPCVSQLRTRHTNTSEQLADIIRFSGLVAGERNQYYSPPPQKKNYPVEKFSYCPKVFSKIQTIWSRKTPLWGEFTGKNLNFEYPSVGNLQLSAPPLLSQPTTPLIISYHCA